MHSIPYTIHLRKLHDRLQLTPIIKYRVLTYCDDGIIIRLINCMTLLIKGSHRLLMVHGSWLGSCLEARGSRLVAKKELKRGPIEIVPQMMNM